MSTLISLLLSFTGRINRAKWWLAFAVIAAANILGGLLLNPDFFLADEPPPPSWPDTVWQIALLWPMTAITVKRFKDADRPAWLGYWFAPMGAALYLGPHIRQLFGPLEQATLAAFVMPMFIYFLFAFIDNGFVPGTQGPNRYGPDPLAQSAAPA